MPRRAQGCREPSSPKGAGQSKRISVCSEPRRVFSSMGARRLGEAIEKTREVSCNRNQIIFEQGAPGDAVYIVETGEYTVHHKQAGDKPVARFTSGDVFGELALLYNTPRNATVKCKAAGTQSCTAHHRSYHHSTSQHIFLRFLRVLPFLRFLPFPAFPAFPAFPTFSAFVLEGSWSRKGSNAGSGVGEA